MTLLPLRRSGKGDNAENSWADPFGDSPDGAALACGVPSFERNDDPQAFLLDPFLQMTELDLKLLQLFVIVLALHSLRTIAAIVGALAFIFILAHESGSRLSA